jgi:hypothetical protein
MIDYQPLPFEAVARFTTSFGVSLYDLSGVLPQPIRAGGCVEEGETPPKSPPTLERYRYPGDPRLARLAH